MSPRTRALAAFVTTSLVVLTPSGAPAAEPFCNKTDVFTARTGGYATYRIPGIIVTGKGTLLAYCEARKTTKSDWGAIDVLVRRSTDGGRTWDEPHQLLDLAGKVPKNPVAVRQKIGREGEATHNNPVMIVDRGSGTVHFLCCVEYRRCYHLTSTDDGRTFSEPTDVTVAFEAIRSEYPWEVLATGPGHGIQLRNGRLLVPVWLSTGTGRGGHRPSCVTSLTSDDAGKTWKLGAIVANDPKPVANPNETTSVELADGRVMFNVRHESQPRQRGVSISPDGVANWSPLRLDPQLPDPVCMASLACLSARPAYGTNRLLFANCHNPTGRERRNLTVKLSTDEGTTWPVAKTLEPGASGYSDLAVAPDGTVYCLYERGGLDGPTEPQALCLARFNLEWLTDGRDRLDPAR